MSIAENHGGLYQNLRLLRETGGKAECNLFRAMGLDYRFVADGNDIASLIEAFKAVKDSTQPVVVHIVTQKGKGYAPAEQHKETWALLCSVPSGDRRAADGHERRVLREHYARLYDEEDAG